MPSATTPTPGWISGPAGLFDLVRGHRHIFLKLGHDRAGELIDRHPVSCHDLTSAPAHSFPHIAPGEALAEKELLEIAERKLR